MVSTESTLTPQGGLGGIRGGSGRKKSWTICIGERDESGRITRSVVASVMIMAEFLLSGPDSKESFCDAQIVKNPSVIPDSKESSGQAQLVKNPSVIPDSKESFCDAQLVKNPPVIPASKESVCGAQIVKNPSVRPR